ncbi:MAG: FAD-dependent oxidoreductase [Roseofilum sp. SBFL]|uniref:NAD(P)/FAD-dependent oxidoreductase n=1 Tax=unclassified Roseofilum TaxID=2620099 RepID=UPI001B17EA8E|nr:MULTISPECIES: FAD-dependent oxidoreductase [unclassified Roseofilum]MBP0014272.1 FAD-dependent oxidoreductase [Roseofilum sp. SID3]MBP0025371.1 FAD-dependent oxidoreductase [Roseofilum sp. SID2]MBP0036146.1 FAD-dependent oxidoreductase [Roseofilum sp. SID1]MBP0041152.1 FAD-dependent oxidoreductase [Roseofilum sp. SBFL]
MTNVVVIGAGLGGLPAVHELRSLLPKSDRLILISDRSHFTFIPGLIRVTLGMASLESIQIDLEPHLKRLGIEWINHKVTALNPHTQTITVEGGQTVNYDYVAIATGASFAFDAIPGLGPHGGYTQSVCTPDHAIHAREAWVKYLENPGPLVVGAAPGAGCFGPAYEFLLMADSELRRRGLRDRVTLTYITPEPYIGHLGVSDVKNAKEYTSELLKERGIETFTNAEITAITPDKITLKTGQQLPFSYSMILPSFRGAKFLQQLPDVANAKGFIPVNPTYRHRDFPSIYALGVAVALDQPDKTPIPIGLPKSGAMTEAMAVAVAHNIAVASGAVSAPFQRPTLESVCLAEYGETGIVYVAIPVLPDPSLEEPQNSYALKGRWVVWGKELLEYYFMVKMRWGLGMPWFERLGLRILFQVNIAKPYTYESLQLSQ